MKVLIKDKVVLNKDVRCSCNRYLFSIKDKEIYVKCRRCKKEHKVVIVK